MKAHRRQPGDRGGAWYLRLNVLFPVKFPAQRGNLNADVVIDLTTAVLPFQCGYPVSTVRDRR